MGAIAVGAAVLLIFVSLWPAERKKRSEEAAADDKGAEATAEKAPETDSEATSTAEAGAE